MNNKRNLVIALLLGALLARTSAAQYAWDQVVLLAKGSYTTTSSISVGTSGAVLLDAANNKRADLTCRNNSSYVVYIGTNAAGTTLTGIGFPVLANEAVTIGAFSDSIYAIASGGTADVRCWEGQLR